MDSLQLAAFACIAALAAGGAGAFILALSRRRSIATQISVVALTALGAVTAGAVTAAERMFISGHDLKALAVVLVASAATGAVIAVSLGHRVAAGSRSLGAAARVIGRGEALPGLERPPTGELAALAHELEQMSRRLEEGRARERALESSRRELIAWVSQISERLSPASVRWPKLSKTASPTTPRRALATIERCASRSIASPGWSTISSS